MTNTIEKVARAICLSDYGYYPPPDWSNKTEDNYRYAAKAAIAALADGELSKAGLQAALEFDSTSDKIRGYLTALKEGKLT